DNSISARETASHTDRRHRGFSSGTHKANLFNRRNDVADQFGKLDFTRGRSAEGSTDFQNVAQCVEDFRRAMTEDQRTPGSNVIDVPPATRIPDGRTIPAFDKWWFAADRAKRWAGRVHSPGYDLLGTRKELFRWTHS